MPGNNKLPTADRPNLADRGGVDPALTKGDKTAKAKSGPVMLAVAASKRPHNRATRSCEETQDRLNAAKPRPQAHFHKTLNHDADGNVQAPVWSQFIEALKTLDQTGNAAPLADVVTGPRKWVNPLAGFAVDTELSDPCAHTIPAPPALDSAEAAAEIVELYWMALLRDVPFDQWPIHPDVQAAINELKNLPLYINRAGNVNAAPTGTNGYVAKPTLDPQSLFRGGELHKGEDDREHHGPFVSQFLLRDISYGSLFISQRQKQAIEGVDYITDPDEWLAVQNGQPRDATANLRGRDNPDLRRHFISMRDLTTYVHFDQLHEAYFNAALILLGEGYPLNVGNPYGRYCDLYGVGTASTAMSTMTTDHERLGRNQDGFGTFGGPHILSLVPEVATRALKAVWRQKWTHLRLRPEAYAGLLHHGGVAVSPGTFGTAGEPILTSSINGGAIRRVSKRFTPTLQPQGGGEATHDYLLPMAFPEGSPTHPAYGAGHACVAGACVTILKAFFDTRALMHNPVVPTADGKALMPYTGDDAGLLTVGRELDKLASNIAVARNMAGVHWRSDYTQSLLLGQRVAVDVLYRQSRDYAEEYCFHFPTFGGGTVDVDAQGVKYTDPDGAESMALESADDEPARPVNDHGLADRILRDQDADIAALLLKVI